MSQSVFDKVFRIYSNPPKKGKSFRQIRNRVGALIVAVGVFYYVDYCIHLERKGDIEVHCIDVLLLHLI